MGGRGPWSGTEDVDDNEVARDELGKQRPVWLDPKQQLWKGVLTGLGTADCPRQFPRL